MKLRALFLGLMLVSFNAFGEDNTYTIQLEASKQPDLNRYSTIEQYGVLYTEETNRGLVRVRIGNYDSTSEAKSALGQIKSQGFNDAYITVTSADAGATSQPLADSYSLIPASSAPGDTPIRSPESLPIWHDLSEEQRANVVYLDGVLHIKEGDTFTPLSQFRPNTPSK